MAVMQVKHLSVENRLQDISLELQAGEVMGLIGPNGAGKSTLLNAMIGQIENTGEVLLKDKNLHSYSPQQRACRIALQPQFVESAWALSVHDVVSMGRLPWGDSDQKIILAAMQQANISQLAHRPVDELSGGERARVWLARVLANQAAVLLMDEPVANLDIHYQQEVMSLLREYAQAGHAVLIAIHDLSLAAKFCDRLCLLNEQQLVISGSVDEVLKEQVLSSVFQVGVFVDLQSKPPVVLTK